MSNVLELSESEFESQVLRADGPVVKLAAEFAGRAKFVKINVDDAPRLAMQYGITGVPTLIVFRGGLIVEEFVGLPDPRGLYRRLNELAPVAATPVAGG